MMMMMMMMKTKTLSETLDYNAILIRVIAREGFTAGF
jgi:hypothetical protein